MLSKRKILIAVISLLVLAAGLFLFKSKVFNWNANPDQPLVDSLAMIEKLTPQIEELSNLIKENPGNANLFYARANAYFDFGNLKFALLDYEKAYHIDSTDAKIALGLSDCLFEVNNADGAIGILQNYLRTDPQNTDILFNLGLDYYYLPKPQYQKAIDAFNEVLKLDLQYADAYFFKGMAYKETGDTVKAISNFQTAVETDPDYFDAFMQLGIIYAAKKNDLALKYFDNAIAVNDTSMEAQYAKAKYFQDRGNLNDAIKNYHAMIVNNPQDADAIYNLATIYFGMDSIQKAYYFYGLAIKQSPAKASAYYGKGLCAEEMKKTEEAISLYNQALNLNPDLKDAEERLLKLNAE